MSITSLVVARTVCAPRLNVSPDNVEDWEAAPINHLTQDAVPSSYIWHHTGTSSFRRSEE